MSNGLISKTRYSLGAEYEFNKSSSFDLGYSLDHKYKKQTNNNIVAFNYKYKF
jgi:long-subunit fatty acid transport protein